VTYGLAFCVFEVPLFQAKPFTSVADQLALLKGRGMSVGDEHRASAYLERVGYYRLSGYWHPMRVSTKTADNKTTLFDSFREGTTFEQVIDLYVFDKTLRLLVLDAIERVEVALRTSIALTLGRYSPHAHREAQFLSRRWRQHGDWIGRLDKATVRSREEFVKHYRAKYTPPIPIWIAVELWDFGMLSHFLSNMRDRDLDHIASRYGLQRRLLLCSWVRSINFVRNLCAHHCRLWNRVIIDQPMPTTMGEISELDHISNDRHAQSRLYGTLSAIRFLLRTSNPSSSWAQRLSRHIETLPQIPAISLRHMGLPQGWKDLALWSC